MDLNLLEKLNKIDQVIKERQQVLDNVQEKETVSTIQPQQQIISSKPKQKVDSKKNKAMQQYENDLKKKEQQKMMTILRKSGNEMWQDESLNDWPDGDYRVFVGDLGNEVNDEHLATAFRKYQSFHRAKVLIIFVSKVIRCKKSNKSRGYGFVSLLDSQDYLKALKEMQGKYIGNRPIKVKASEWQKRSYQNNRNKFKDQKVKFIKKKIVKK